MNTYQGLFIFPVSLDEQSLEKAVDRVCEDIVKLGGQVDGRRVIGRRSFARPMKKQDSGYYARITFSADPAAASAFLARCKLNDTLFRVQIVKAEGLIPDGEEGTPPQEDDRPRRGGRGEGGSHGESE